MLLCSWLPGALVIETRSLVKKDFQCMCFYGSVLLHPITA